MTETALSVRAGALLTLSGFHLANDFILPRAFKYLLLPIQLAQLDFCLAFDALR